MRTIGLGVFLTVIASSARTEAQDQRPTPLPIEVRLELSTLHRTVLTWEPLPMTLILTSVGNEGAPFGEDLWAGSYGGARLVLVVEDSEESTEPKEFVLEPVGHSLGCYSLGTYLLKRGEERSTSFAVGGKTKRVLDDSGKIRSICEPAFPRAGRYGLRACYRYEGEAFYSNTVLVDASEPTGWGAQALEFVKTLEYEAVWLYEQQLVGGLDDEQKARFVHLAEDFGVNPYSDYARYALAVLETRALQRPELSETDQRAHSARARCLLEGIASPGFKFANEVQKLSAWLVQREGLLRHSRKR